jgi:hypothetical protein
MERGGRESSFGDIHSEQRYWAMPMLRIFDNDKNDKKDPSGAQRPISP